MASSLPLEKMSVEEKLQAMESLWDDLCSQAGVMTSPAWHEDVLAERDTMQKRGDDAFEDWEAAKRLKIMADYNRDNKSSLPAAVRKHRELIVDLIMEGYSVQEAFSKVSQAD